MDKEKLNKRINKFRSLLKKAQCKLDKANLSYEFVDEKAKEFHFLKGNYDFNKANVL